MNSASSSVPQKAIDACKERPGLFRLTARVQHYAWGDAQFIPRLLGIANPDARPFAELWIGAHPDLPAKVHVADTEVDLNMLLREVPEQLLGSATAGQYSACLPYLLKVLAAAFPLSIQAHPTKKQAEEGFARENKSGIPLAAGERNYKDDNHKPEMIVALTDFYGLRGFRPLHEIASTLDAVPEFRRMIPEFQPTSTCLTQRYEEFMNRTPEEVDAVLGPLVQRLRKTDCRTPFGPMDHEYWVLQCAERFCRNGHHDPGLFSIYLLNLVHLRPGEGMYLPAGILHAYLRGAAMEIMANSNNVLRGGLTSKYVDVPELLRIVSFERSAPEIVRPVQIGDTPEWAYRTPAREFELRRIELERRVAYHSPTQHSADTLILVDVSDETQVTIASSGQVLELARGNIVLAPARVEYHLESTGPATVYKATVP
jgi:mannose-6-phosphate isomerase class I